MLDVPMSLGDVLDRITILEIKAARVQDPSRRANVGKELALLQARWSAAGLGQPPQKSALRAVNEALWDVEEQLRRQERDQDFGAEFVRLARSVYQLNDQRAAIKRALNLELGSALIEEKEYLRE